MQIEIGYGTICLKEQGLCCTKFAKNGKICYNIICNPLTMSVFVTWRHYMTLRDAILEEIALRNEFDVEAIKSLEVVYVEQHKQRAIAEQMVNYPSLIKGLVELINNNGVECVDIHITKVDHRGKPYWMLSQSNPKKAVLCMNSL